MRELFYIMTGSWEDTYGPHTATLHGTAHFAAGTVTQRTVFESACVAFQDAHAGKNAFSVDMYVVMPNEIV